MYHTTYILCLAAALSGCAAITMSSAEYAEYNYNRVKAGVESKKPLACANGTSTFWVDAGMYSISINGNIVLRDNKEQLHIVFRSKASTTCEVKEK